MKNVIGQTVKGKKLVQEALETLMKEEISILRTDYQQLEVLMLFWFLTKWSNF
jgi:hypothetical protein